MNNPWHLYLMVSIYFFVGSMHFIKPKAFMRIMPRYFLKQKLLVYLSGFAEILLAIGLLFSSTRNLSVYIMILMLIVFLLVHFYMLSGEKASAGIPKWILILRIPLQFVLMFWVFSYLN